ncbi:sodium-dependent transporter [Corynebacterium ulceribovis]|uniref:sodium-dependent transporter n=1 Tax=Corynebacterium ulceribovis TaxID=487732 RepID=UPI00037794D0|nr:sodium-dependent transporter [Corynebacterium ulceribovis]
MVSPSSGSAGNTQNREVFSSRAAFLFAAIGSAVGLGNIWRFPYVAYDSGGGAFLIPYLVALLSAGIPLLFLDYAIGHRFRGSAPKSFRRIARWAEPIGWIQVGICFFITIYYAVIIGWALLYSLKSVNKAWGDDPGTYFMEDFLKLDAVPVNSMEFVTPILIALVVVWAVTLGVLAFGVDKGIGKVSLVFIPLLAVLFIIIVAYAITLDGAVDGLNAFFTPDWSALRDSSVWIAAYGQIFFSLSVAFGIMLTYASYLKPRTNLTGAGLVTSFANSSFEVLAGVGVFSVLGFMAKSQGVGVEEVASSGIGLAFVAFPAVISELPAGIGPIFGVLFFLSLVIAGLTSLMSLVEVVVSSVQDKLNLARVPATLGIGGLMAVISVLLFSTTSGLVSLDIMDKFTNNIGIVLVALLTIFAVDWILRRTTEFGMHLNAVSSFRVGVVWRMCVAYITPVVLGLILTNELVALLQENYEGYSNAQINTYGWGVVGGVLVLSLVLSLAPWRGKHRLDGPPGSDFGVTAHFDVPAHPPRKHTPGAAAAEARLLASGHAIDSTDPANPAPTV